ncbi:MAG: AAA family ATPase, partial [Candidatus Gracilibacteria bacterium]
MKIKSLRVKNFRLLENIPNIELDASYTIIVGRNNSGKTSLTELFKKFLNEGSKFQFEDFSLHSYAKFQESFKLYKDYKDETNEEEKEEKERVFRESIPKIELQITFIIEASDGSLDLSGLDLDDTTNEYKVLLEYTFKNALEFFEKAILQSDFLKYLKKNFDSNLEIRSFFIDSTGLKNKFIGNIGDIFKTDFIDAQRHLDDNS